MIHCPVCSNTVKITKIACSCCDVQLAGNFNLPRLARLPFVHQKLAEQLLMAGGNLKAMSETLNISYPTLRKRVDELINAITHLRKDDEAKVEKILSDIEKGVIKPEHGMRMVKEINGEL